MLARIPPSSSVFSDKRDGSDHIHAHGALDSAEVGMFSTVDLMVKELGWSHLGALGCVVYTWATQAVLK